MSSANSLRRFFAMPLVAFDWVRIGMNNNPRSGNYVMMMSSFVAILIVGNGADKMTTAGGLASKYESYRRANRYFVPYFMAGYQYRFPEIKQ